MGSVSFFLEEDAWGQQGVSAVRRGAAGSFDFLGGQQGSTRVCPVLCTRDVAGSPHDNPSGPRIQAFGPRNPPPSVRTGLSGLLPPDTIWQKEWNSASQIRFLGLPAGLPLTAPVAHAEGSQPLQGRVWGNGSEPFPRRAFRRCSSCQRVPRLVRDTTLSLVQVTDAQRQRVNKGVLFFNC